MDGAARFRQEATLKVHAMEAMDCEPDSPFEASVARIVTVFVWGSLFSMRVPSFKF